MKVAVIIMSILGCDDTGTQCVPVATVPRRWTTIAACDAESEAELNAYGGRSYPMIVAVCQTATDTASIAPEVEADQATKPLTDEHRASLFGRAISLVTDVLPSVEGMKDAVTTPVHLVTETYSWVARKVGG